MVDVGISDEGVPDYPLERLENGFVVPDASPAAIHRNHDRQVENQVEVAVRAEELGFEYVLHPELHFYLMGKSSPNPILTQVAVAERTESLRLMQMANILPWHEPVRLAEQIATLDQLSGGRVEVGVGNGWGTVEAETLGQYWGGTSEHDAMNHASFEEKYEILMAAWTEDLVAHHGQFHDVPPTYVEWESNLEYHYLANDDGPYEPDDYLDTDGEVTTLRSVPVYPQPAQQPHPQIWRPTMSPPVIEWAARRGVNGCCHCTDFSAVAERIDRYHATAEEAGWPDHRPEYDGEPFRRGWDERRRRGVATILNVFDTDVADEDTYRRWKLGCEADLASSDETLPPDGPDEVTVDVEAKLAELDAPIVGGTEEIVDRIAEFVETCGYEDLILVPQLKNFGMTHEEHLEQLRAFADGVIPYFEEQYPTEP